MSEAEFGPNQRISREQMAAMVIRVYEYVQGVQAPKVSKLGAYVDGQSVSDWAQTSVDKALVLGIMKGKGSSQFAPQDEATRAEAVMVIWNLLQLIP